MMVNVYLVINQHANLEIVIVPAPWKQAVLSWQTAPRRGRRGRDRMVDLQLHVQLVPITTKVVSSNPANGEVYSMQH